MEVICEVTQCIHNTYDRACMLNNIKIRPAKGLDPGYGISGENAVCIEYEPKG